MSNTSFQFKHFSVSQERCAMKVGTDGVLLGAWANGGRHILDIGAGTGLLSLMLAQRFPVAEVQAVEIDEDACRQARENVTCSPFASRIKVYQSALQQFRPDVVFDCVVSNPPYFVDSLQSPDKSRAQARHADSLPFDQLFSCVKSSLSFQGRFSVIVPLESLVPLLATSCLSGFYVSRKCYVKTVPHKEPKRCLLEFVLCQPTNVEVTEVVLQESNGGRSAWYSALTSDFYL